MSFAHLHIHSPFSFLDGASDVGVLVRRCAELEMPALALTDRNSVAGAVRLQKACEKAGIRAILGAELTLEDGAHLTLLARSAAGYENLCRILSKAHLENERGVPRASWESVRERAAGLLCLSGCRRGPACRALLREDIGGAERALSELAETFGRECTFVELQRTALPGDRLLNEALRSLAAKAGLPVVATNNVHHARKEDFPLYDVMTCIRTGCRMDEPRPERSINAERYLKSPDAMRRIFRGCPEAAANTLRVADMCEAYSLGGHCFLPRFPFLHPGESAGDLLRAKTYAGAERRYGRISEALRARIERELATISALGFADYFLIFENIVEVARQKGIRFAGRGSAADSVVAYCLHLTNVDAFGRNHTFERFISSERAHSLPDVDVDFDARYRDTIAGYVTQTYGAEHTAAVATFQCYHARGALRDIGKALGFREGELGILAKRLPMFSGADDIERLLDTIPEVRALNISRQKFRLLFDLCRRIADLPRHIGTHASGVVITGRSIYGVASLQQSAKRVLLLPFDKVDVEDLGLVKLDFLHLRMLGAVEDTMRDLERTSLLQDREPLRFEAIPLDDRPTYALLNTGETAGVFQLESPAQRALQSRLFAKTIEDVVQSVAAIRPGPLKGEMVEPWVRRKTGREPVAYLLPELRPILHRTYGVVLFQEQVIDICVTIAGFTPGEADILRRAMTHKRTREEMEQIRGLFLTKAQKRGYDRQTAEIVFEWVHAYGGYGFCEGHAAAFGDTAYRTAFLLAHHPAEFYAALLNNQPMGYWPSYVLVQEAKRRKIGVLPLDVNRSREDFRVEEGQIRVGWRAVRGLREKARERMSQERQIEDFRSIVDFIRRVEPARNELEALVMAGAFDGLHPNRRSLLWAIAQEKLPATSPENPMGLRMPSLALPHVREFSDYEMCALESKALGFSPRWHVFEFLREELRRKGLVTCAEAKSRRDGSALRVAGIPVHPHRPPTRSGKTVVFLTLSDETGLLDVTVFDRTYQRWGAEIFQPGVLTVEGRMSRRRGISLIASRVTAA